MKKFDIELAKAGAPVCTREGRPARIVCFDKKSDRGFSIVALVDNDGYEELEVCTTGGCYLSDKEDRRDLMMAPTQHTGYVALCRKESGVPMACASVYADRESAEAGTKYMSQLLAIGEITWEE